VQQGHGQFGCALQTLCATAMPEKRISCGSSGGNSLRRWARDAGILHALRQWVPACNAAPTVPPLQDEAGVLGHATVPLAVASSGLKCGALLDAVFAYYQQPLEGLEPSQVAAAVAGRPAAARALAAAVHAAGPGAPRGLLLGARCAFEGLSRATRDPAGTIYEVHLAR
jgi:hypothetical protein